MKKWHQGIEVRTCFLAVDHVIFELVLQGPCGLLTPVSGEHEGEFAALHRGIEVAVKARIIEHGSQRTQVEHRAKDTRNAQHLGTA